MAAPQKYSHIDFTPPAGARKQAEQGLKLRREHGRGGTAVGIARARDISNGVELSPSTVRRMKAFFDRHASDSKAEGFRQGEKGWPSNGVIANKLWGGPAGYSWAKKVVAQMEAADARSTYSLDAEASTIEAGTDRRSAVIPNVERRFLGNFSETEEANPELLRVEERADPETGKRQTYLVGYAARFGKNSLLLGDFVERIAPSAFEIVEKRKDADGKPLETRCLFNHSPDNLLGRFPTTMRMWVDEQGLRYECLLPETRKDIAELVARGDLKGSSFSFIVAEGGEKWSTEEGRSIRLVTRIKSLLDCGPVTYPAYDSATVAVAKRSYDQFVASKEPTPVVEKRDSGIADRVAEEARKTQEFLAERRGFCPTGDGGGVDNSCGKDEAGGVAGAVKSMAKGAAAGAAAGAVTGVGALIGAATGAVLAPLMKAIKKYGVDSAEKAHYEKLKEKSGITDKDVNKVSSILSGGEGKVKYFASGDDLTMEMNGTDTYAFVSSKSHFDDKADGTSLHVMQFERQPDINSVKQAAKAIGAKNVTFEVSGRQKYGLDKQQKESLRKDGHKEIKPGVWKVNLSASSKKRSIEELQSFLAERRGFCPTGEGGGIDNSCGGGKGGGAAAKPGPNPNDGLKTIEQQRIEAAGKSGFVPAPKVSDKPKSLEQQRLEAAGEWDDRIDLPALAEYDGGDNGGFVPDYHRDVTIPGTNQKAKINVDDAEHVKQFVELSAKASGVSVDEFMKANRFGGTLQKLTEHDKVKLFGGNWKQYRTKLARSGGWGNKELDETAKRIGSTLRAGRIKGETLAHAVREYAKETGKDPKDEMYSGMKTYQRDPREFMQWARKRLDHYFASGKGKWGARSADGIDSIESRIESLSQFFQSRGFCPTGEGGGVDNSCSSSGSSNVGGGKLPKGIVIDARPPSIGVAGGKGTGIVVDARPPSIGVAKGKGTGIIVDARPPSMKSGNGDPVAKSGQLSGYKVAPKMGYDSGKKSGDYKEWKKGDHLDKEKEKDTQDFLDKARTDQLARGGKDGGKSDDGGGVQTWSKGEHFPWTTKQVGTDKGYIQGQHPDGSKTAKYPFEGDPSEAHKKVIEEIKSKKKDKRSITLPEMTAFLMERAG